jgi:hypothetical protein
MSALPQYNTTSQQYKFASIDVDLIIRDAYERCGIENYQISAIQAKSARTSLDFLFSHWINRGLNLFTVIQYVIPIVNSQSVYSLPANTSKVLEGIRVTMDTIYGGTATSSAGGTAANAFTVPYSSPCTQTSINGNISYLYPTAKSIYYVGIESATTQIYKISVDCSFLTSPSEGDWINILNTSSQNYYFGQPNWFQLPTTKTAVNWRIRESGGGTLNIAGIFFNVPTNSLAMECKGREDYAKQTLNTPTMTPSVYWANRINPLVIKLYGKPNVTTPEFMCFNCVRYIQDCGDFQNSVDANSRFIEPATAGLAAKLAEKYAIDRCDRLVAMAEKVYIEAGQEDTENVPSQVQFSLDGGFA